MIGVIGDKLKEEFSGDRGRAFPKIKKSESGIF